MNAFIAYLRLAVDSRPQWSRNAFALDFRHFET